MEQKGTHISIRDALEGDREAAREVTLAAYEEYAIKAFDVFSFDYILKPVNQVRFNQSLDKVLFALDT